MKKLFDYVSIASTAYLIYQNAKTQKALQSVVYNQLPPEIQAQWRSIFGMPSDAASTASK